MPAPDCKIQITNGNTVPKRKQALVQFFPAGKNFEGPSLYYNYGQHPHWNVPFQEILSDTGSQE